MSINFMKIEQKSVAQFFNLDERWFVTIFFFICFFMFCCE